MLSELDKIIINEFVLAKHTQNLFFILNRFDHTYDCCDPLLNHGIVFIDVVSLDE
tara:strand:- start:425 stop:589 length:165 start_codon:yes stop_codon:yes gene_type:complete